jgi:diamine N-acetyltransferase
MTILQGNRIGLRPLEPEDLDFLYTVENTEDFWEVSHTQTPYSRFVLHQYLENAHQDIYEAKQLRLIAYLKSSQEAIGAIDLFDFNPQHRRAGIGILITKEQQHQGYASEALDLIIPYCFKHLQLHQLFANITEDNKASLNLFKSKNFRKIGSKKDWIFHAGKFKDELLFQLIND